MKIIESSIIGKKSPEACEDGMVVTDDFIAVIDGSTSKTPKHLNPDMKNGRYAMMLISEYIREELKADASVDDFCQGVTAYIYNKVYEEKYSYCTFCNIGFHMDVFSAYDGSRREHGISSSS